MSVQSIHGVYAVRLFDAAEASAIILDGTADQAVNISNSVEMEATAGALHPRFVPLRAQSFRCPITTRRIKDALDAIGVTGRFFLPDTGKPGVEVCFQKYSETAGGRAGTSSHIKHTIAAGFIAPMSLQCSHQSDASLAYEIIPKYDGVNIPVVHNANQTLAALVGDDERFTLGPVSLGGQAIAGVSDVNINFGLNFALEGTDSDIWATFISLHSVMPSITISGTDLTQFASKVPIGGRALTHANTTIFLRKRSESGFVADGTSEHISITVAGQAFVENMQASVGGRATNAIRLYPKFDGTNTPIVIDTTAAIS